MVNRQQYKGSYTAKQFNTNIVEGFRSTKYNAKGEKQLDREGHNIHTTTAINGLSNAYGLTTAVVRYMIGDTISKERNNEIKVKDIAQEYGIAKSTIYRYLDIAKNYKPEGKKETHNPTYVAKSNPREKVRTQSTSKKEIPVVIPQEQKESPLEKTVLGPIGSNGLPLGAPNNAYTRARPLEGARDLGAGAIGYQMKNRLKKIGLGIAAGAILIGTFFGGRYLGYHQAEKLYSGLNKPGISCPVENPQTGNIYAEKIICGSQKHLYQCHNVQKAPAKAEIKKQEQKTNYVTKIDSTRFTFFQGDQTPIVPVVVQEKKERPKIYIPKQDTALVQSYNQGDLANMLSTECKDPYIRTAAWTPLDLLFNIPEIVRTSKHRKTADYKGLVDIVKQGENIFGNSPVINVYKIDGATGYDMPNDFNGSCGPKGKWEVESSLNGMGITTHSYFWNNMATENVQETKPTGRINFAQFGQAMETAHEDEKPVVTQHLVGDTKHVDSLVVQEQYWVSDGPTNLPFKLTVQNPFYDKNDKAVNGAVLLGIGEAAAVIGLTNIGDGGGLIPPGRSGDEHILRFGGSLIAP